MKKENSKGLIGLIISILITIMLVLASVMLITKGHVWIGIYTLVAGVIAYEAAASIMLKLEENLFEE